MYVQKNLKLCFIHPCSIQISAISETNTVQKDTAFYLCILEINNMNLDSRKSFGGFALASLFFSTFLWDTFLTLGCVFLVTLIAEPLCSNWSWKQIHIKASKCKCLLISRSCRVTNDNIKLKNSFSKKLLIINVDLKLRFKENLDGMTKKASRVKMIKLE